MPEKRRTACCGPSPTVQLTAALSPILPMLRVARTTASALSPDDVVSSFEHDDISPTALKWAVGHLAQITSSAHNPKTQSSMQCNAGCVFGEYLGNKRPVSGALGRRHHFLQQAATKTTSLPSRRDIDRDLANTLVDRAGGSWAYTGPGRVSAAVFHNQRKSAFAQKARSEAVPIMRRIPESSVTRCKSFCVDHGNCGGVRMFRSSGGYVRHGHMATAANRTAMPTSACTTAPPVRMPIARPSLFSSARASRRTSQ